MNLTSITNLAQNSMQLQFEPYNFGVGLFAGFVLVLFLYMWYDIIRNKIIKPKKKHDLQGLRARFEELYKASKVIETHSEELNKLMLELENA